MVVGHVARDARKRSATVAPTPTLPRKRGRGLDPPRRCFRCFGLPPPFGSSPVWLPHPFTGEGWGGGQRSDGNQERRLPAPSQDQTLSNRGQRHSAPASCASRAALKGLPSYQFGHWSPSASAWPTPCSSSRSSTMPSQRQPSWTSSLGWW